MEILKQPLFAGLTVLHVLLAVVGLSVIAAVVGALTKKRVTPAGHLVKRRCMACGWGGDVSKHAQKCPKCSKPLAG